MENNKLISKVFMWLFLGLMVSFGVGMLLVNNLEIMVQIITNPIIFWGIFIVELGIAVGLSGLLKKMNAVVAGILYFVYAITTGLTISVLLLLYTTSSFILVFAIAAVIFLIFAIIGYFTKLDLSKISTILFMALMAIILTTIINLFLQNGTLEMIISIVAVVVFVAYIAYDMQVIIKNNALGIENENTLAIKGAFNLYLDFINLFIKLLSLFGKRKD